MIVVSKGLRGRARQTMPRCRHQSAHAMTISTTMPRCYHPSAHTLTISTTTLSGSSFKSSLDLRSRSVAKLRNATELVARIVMSGSVSKAPSNALLLNTVCCGLNTIGFTKETQGKLEQEESKGSMAKNAVLPSSSTEVVKIVGRLIKHCSAKVDCNVNTTDVVGAHFSHGRVICTKDDRFKTAVADLVGKLSRDSTYIGPSGNLLQVDMENMEDVDVIIAGPPCPPFSSIGSRGGLNDEHAEVFGAVHNMLKNQYRQKALTLWRWWRA